MRIQDKRRGCATIAVRCAMAAAVAVVVSGCSGGGSDGSEGAESSVTTSPLIDRPGDMDFAQRLAALRKERGINKQTLARKVGIHRTQIRRYEAGTSQPTLDVLRGLAVALSVSTDALVCNEDERGPDTPSACPTPAVEAIDTSDWTTYTSDLYDLEVGHPPGWTETPASRKWLLDADGKDL